MQYNEYLQELCLALKSFKASAKEEDFNLKIRFVSFPEHQSVLKQKNYEGLTYSTFDEDQREKQLILLGIEKLATSLENITQRQHVVNVINRIKEELEQSLSLVNFLINDNVYDFEYFNSKFPLFIKIDWKRDQLEDQLDHLALSELMRAIETNLFVCNKLLNELKNTGTESNFLPLEGDIYLTLKQIALLYIYKKQHINTANADTIAKEFNHNSGHKLLQHYAKHYKRTDRISAGGKTATSLIKDIETILPLLSLEEKKEAEDEIFIVESKRL